MNMSKPTPFGGRSAAVEVTLLQPAPADATTGSHRGLAGQDCYLKTFEITTGVKGEHPLGCLEEPFRFFCVLVVLLDHSDSPYGADRREVAEERVSVLRGERGSPS